MYMIWQVFKLWQGEKVAGSITEVIVWSIRKQESGERAGGMGGGYSLSLRYEQDINRWTH